MLRVSRTVQEYISFIFFVVVGGSAQNGRVVDMTLVPLMFKWSCIGKIFDLACR